MWKCKQQWAIQLSMGSDLNKGKGKHCIATKGFGQTELTPSWPKVAVGGQYDGQFPPWVSLCFTKTPLNNGWATQEDLCVTSCPLALFGRCIKLFKGHANQAFNLHSLITAPLASQWTLSYATPQCGAMLLSFCIIQVMWPFDVWK